MPYHKHTCNKLSLSQYEMKNHKKRCFIYLHNQLWWHVLQLKQFPYNSKFPKKHYFHIFLLLKWLSWNTPESSLNLSFICEVKNWTKILTDSGMHLTTRWGVGGGGEELSRESTGNARISFNWIFWVTESFKSAETFKKIISFPTKINVVLLTKQVHSFKTETIAIPWNHFEINSHCKV